MITRKMSLIAGIVLAGTTVTATYSRATSGAPQNAQVCEDQLRNRISALVDVMNGGSDSLTILFRDDLRKTLEALKDENIKISPNMSRTIRMAFGNGSGPRLFGLNASCTEYGRERLENLPVEPGHNAWLGIRGLSGARVA